MVLDFLPLSWWRGLLENNLSRHASDLLKRVEVFSECSYSIALFELIKQKKSTEGLLLCRVSAVCFRKLSSEMVLIAQQQPNKFPVGGKKINECILLLFQDLVDSAL